MIRGPTMNVLIIRSNPVNPDSRVEKEIRALIENGYNVTLLAWDRSEDYNIRKEPLNEKMKGVIAFRIGIKAPYGSGIKNLKKLVAFQCVIRSFLKNNKYDIVHACDFDTAFTAYHSINHSQTKFIYDIFDFYADAFNVPSVLKALVLFADKWIVCGADLTIICSEERSKQLRGFCPKKLAVIHNTPEEICINKEKQEKINDKIKLCYVGILQPGRLLLELAEVVMNSCEYELYIGGFGEYADYFSQLSIKYTNIHYYGKIPYDKTIELESKCDIMIANYDPSVPNHVFAAPNKFYEALYLGKPLVMTKGTGMSNIVTEDDLGVTIEYSKDGLEAGLRCLVERKKEWALMKERMNKKYRNEYSWNEMKKRLVNAYRML